MTAIRARYDGEDLGASEGLLVAIARLFDPLREGETIEVVSQHPTVEMDLRAWCRRAAHRIAKVERQNGEVRLVLERGFVRRSLADPPEWGVRMPRRKGGLDMRDWRVGRHAEVPEEAPLAGALAPRGAPLEPSSAAVTFPLRKRKDLWANAVSDLYEQATASQWRAATDVPWSELGALDDEVERSVCQIMTFLAENEYAALYVPARFIGRIHPQFTEVALFLATVMVDEARHIEVFTKRALANGGGLGVAGSTTQLSLASLFEPEDFSTASFLLSVLGEGTFLDLLSFLEKWAPDPATKELCRRARLDESRHVHFGIAHAKLSLEEDLLAAKRFGKAVEARAAFLDSISGVGALVEEALVVYAGGGLGPSELREGTRRVAGLYESMHQGRLKRLASVGFDTTAAEHLSSLHTPNFM